jgi:hypothetical protein
MLGLGSNLATGGYVGGPTLISSYTSDFTEDADGWEAYSVSLDSNGAGLVFAYDETIDGTSGWLKATYPDIDQLNLSGISNTGLLDTGYAVGDYAIISYKVHFVDDDGKWTGEDTDVSHFFYILGKTNIYTAYLDTTFTVTDQKTTPASSLFSNPSSVLFYVASAPDLPLAGAVFYIKDINIDVWRP